MKKMLTLIMSFLVINNAIQGVQSSMLPKPSSETISGARHMFKLSHGPIPTDIKADHYDKIGDYFETPITLDQKQVSVISYFNLKGNEKELENALSAQKGKMDIRPLERTYCRKAISSMNMFARYRGMLGFAVGAVATFLATGYMNSPLAVKQSSEDSVQ